MGVVLVLVVRHETVVASGRTGRRAVGHEAMRAKPMRTIAVHSIAAVRTWAPRHALESRVSLTPLGDLRQHFRGRWVLPEEAVAVNLIGTCHRNRTTQTDKIDRNISDEELRSMSQTNAEASSTER